MRKIVGKIEDVHGNKGAVRLKPFPGLTESLEDIESVVLTDGRRINIHQDIFEIRRYRRNTYLLKFKDLKWRGDVKNYVNFNVAVC